MRDHASILTITQTENRYPLDIWGCSSAGRAPALHAGGQEFDPPHLHLDESPNLKGTREKNSDRFSNYKGA